MDTYEALSGPELDGPELSGPELNGPGLDGPGLNGPELDRPELDGPGLNGPEVTALRADGPVAGPGDEPASLGLRIDRRPAEAPCAGGADGDRPPMVAALSPSSIATWKQCPKRFFFEKILRLEMEPGLEAVCGSFVHEVLEHLMDLPGPQRTTEAARHLATQRWATFTADPDSRFADLGLGEAATKDFKRRAWTGISGYFSIEDPARIDVVATEQQMRADLDGAPLFGIVDRLERAGQRLVVSDYKTGRAPKWQEEIDEKLGQLRLYAAILDALGTPVSTLRLLFVSPQVGAVARAARCEEAVSTAHARLVTCVPECEPVRLLGAVLGVEDAHRAARAAAGACDDRAEQSRAAACDAAWKAALELVGAPDVRVTEVGQLLLDEVAARRRAFFAHRDAERSRPVEIALDVLPEHIAAARADVAAVWAEATACYEAWDFPVRTGVLCDWCPFSSMCEGYRAWDDAGRPMDAPVPASV